MQTMQIFLQFSLQLQQLLSFDILAVSIGTKHPEVHPTKSALPLFETNKDNKHQQ